MADLINIGTGALLSYQAALNTTSNNIANVNTEGYSRQITSFQAIEPTRTGDFYLGNGVGVGECSKGVQPVFDIRCAQSVIQLWWCRDLLRLRIQTRQPVCQQWLRPAILDGCVLLCTSGRSDATPKMVMPEIAAGAEWAGRRIGQSVSITE